ncbi:hypothetical protein CRYUN_Cryun34aG0011600 [Craigia yunnanensis]
MTGMFCCPNFSPFNPFAFSDVYIFNISRFLELGSILDPGRPPKVDKDVIFVDAVRMVTQLRDEAQKLRESNESQVVGGKLVPYFGYPGVSMWQFLPPSTVDTSQDHILRPPVA